MIRPKMRPREVAVYLKGGVGLSKRQLDEVLSTITAARRRGVLPKLSYRYNPHPRIHGADPLYLLPKSGSVPRFGVKVRTVIRNAFGNKYSVRLV